MAVYFVTGKLGSGKSLISVSKIRDYMLDGRRVATNLDLYLDQMFTFNKTAAVRLPDKPRASDMELLGKGYDHENDRHNDESKYGLIVLDECGTWLNSREWNDKGRRDLINWFLHARKNRWDVIFLIQDIESADAQIVRALCEHLVICRRLDRMRFMKFPLPKVHIANVYYGRNKENFVERWVYKGTDLYDAYDTLQKFKDGEEFFSTGAVDMRASYSFLPAWYMKGRFLPAPPAQLSIRRRLWNFWGGLALKPLLATMMCLLSESEYQRTFHHKRWLERQRQAVCDRRTATIDVTGGSHNPSDVMLALPAPQAESDAGIISEAPASDLHIASIMRSPEADQPVLEHFPAAFSPGFPSL